MKYIETPVTPGKLTATLFEGSDILCVVDGTSGTSYQKRDDIMLAINEHDKLTALHDELVKQRDALVKAGGLAQPALDNFAEHDPTLKKSFSWILAMDRLRDALALVRGEAE